MRLPRRPVVIAWLAACVAVPVLTSCSSGTDAAPGTGVAASVITTTSAVTVALPVVSTNAPTTPPAAAATYVVVAGDALSSIASRVGVRLDDLVAANGWVDGELHAIYPGDVIQLPPGAAVPELPSTTLPPSASSSAESATGGYRAAEPILVLYLDDGRSAPITTPLADGTYYSREFGVAAGGAAVDFTLVQAVSGGACRAELDTVPGGTIDELECIGGYFVLSPSATVRLSAGDAVPVLVLGDTSDRPGGGHSEVAAAEFVRLVGGQAPAADAPAAYSYIGWSALVQIRDGLITRVEQYFES